MSVAELVARVAVDLWDGGSNPGLYLDWVSALISPQPITSRHCSTHLSRNAHRSVRKTTTVQYIGSDKQNNTVNPQPSEFRLTEISEIRTAWMSPQKFGNFDIS